MKIYFRTNGDSIEYSLDEFDKEESYEYSEFDISDNYSDYEAEILCEKMINEFQINGVSLSSTLEKELDERNKFMESLKNINEFKIVNSRASYIRVSVYLVYRGNFNDERLVETLDISIDDLKDKELVWYDLYLGKKRDNKVKISPAYLEGNELYLLQDDDGEISVVKKNGFVMYYSDDYDEKYIISTQIYCG